MFELLGNPVVLMDLFSVEGNVALAVDFEDVRLNLKSFQYDESDKKVGELTLVLANPNDQFTDDERLQGRGKTIRIQWGYLTHLSAIKTCVITSIEPNYPPNGDYSLTIKAWDTVSRAFLGAYPKNWGYVQTSDIARAIATRHDLFPIIPKESEDVREQPYIQPGKMTDLRYVKALAKRRGWECHSDGTYLYYGPDPWDEEPALYAVYGTTVFEPVYNGAPLVMTNFKPKIKQGKRPDTRKSSVDPKKKQAVSKKANDRTVSQGDNDRQSLGEATVVSFSDRSIETRRIEPEVLDAGAGKVKPSTAKSAVQVEKDTKAEQWAVKKKALEATATFAPGNPELRLRRTIEIAGVGKTYQGKWRISGARHRITVGSTVYSVTCSFIRSSKGEKSASDEKAENPNTKTTKKDSKEAKNVEVVEVDFASRSAVTVTRPQ